MPSDPAGPATMVEELPDVGATHALAARLARRLGPGDVLALVGDLGAGKTELTRGLAAALGLPPGERVLSPSYMLLQVHAGGRVPLAHFDAYFMEGPDDLLRAGFPELLEQGHLVVVEWADRVAPVLPPRTLWLTLEHAGAPGARRARLDDPGSLASRPSA